MHRPLLPQACALLLLAALGCSADRDARSELQSAGSLDAFDLRVGDCFDDSFFDTEEVSSLAGVPCSEGHDNEVYALFDIPGNSWPGEDELEVMADDGCYERFQSAIGTSYEESVLMYTTLYPTQESWARLADREVICIAYHMETEKLTGSVLGSGL